LFVRGVALWSWAAVEGRGAAVVSERAARASCRDVVAQETPPVVFVVVVVVTVAAQWAGRCSRIKAAHLIMVEENRQ